jgi:hypothetical protein
MTTIVLGAKPYLSDSINPRILLFDHLEYKKRVLMATKIQAVFFWVTATYYLVGGYQYLMECW